MRQMLVGAAQIVKNVMHRPCAGPRAQVRRHQKLTPLGATGSYCMEVVTPLSVEQTTWNSPDCLDRLLRC
jgi:hypothetical protein